MATPIRDGKSTVAYRNREVSVSKESKPKTEAKTDSTTDTKPTSTKDKAIDKAKNAQLTVYKGQSSFEAGDKRHEVNGTGPAGIKTNAYAQGPSFKMDANASAKAGLKGVDVDVNVHIDANLVKAGASAEKDVHFKFQGQDFDVKVKLGADTQVGANGDLKIKLHMGPNGISADLGAEGFAGAKGSLSGSIELDANGKELAHVGTKVTLAAGAMAGAKLEAGLDHFKASAYAAVGVGVGLEVDGKVNYGNVASLLPKLVSPEALWGDAKAIGGAAIDGAKDLGHKAADKLSDAWHSVF